MPSSLRDEIRHTRPLQSPAQEVMLALGRTWSMLGPGFSEAQKPFGITPTQHSALRIPARVRATV